MALKLRPTGLGHGVYKDNVDYGVLATAAAPPASYILALT
jgi:hypothetical protein